MKFVELKKHIAEGQFKPFYIVTGDDSFVVRKATDMFKMLAGAYPDLNVSHFSKDATNNEIVSALNSLPFLGERRVIFVENYTTNLDGVKEYLKNPNPTSILVIVGDLTQNLTALAKIAEVVDCNRLDEKFLINWVGTTIIKAGCQIGNLAAGKIVEYCNRDMNRISAEVDKLISYANGGSITVETVEEMIAPDLEFKVFELSEAIAQKNKDRAVNLAQKMLEGSNAETKIFGLIFSHFRRLLHISLNPQSDTLASDLNTPEFVIKKSIKLLSSYSPRRLKLIVDKLHALDFVIKNNATYAKNAIISFVCETVLIG